MAGMLNQRAELMAGTAMSPMRERIPGTLSPRQPQQAPDEDEEAPNVSESEQAEYEKFVLDAFDLIYEGDRVRPGVRDLLDDDPADLIAVLGNQDPFDPEKFTPVVALGATAAVIVLELARRAEGKIDGAVMLHGGQEILEELASVAISAGIHDFSSEELSDALLAGMDLYRLTAEAQGMYDPAAAQEDVAELKRADQEGKFFDLVPQLRPFAGQEG